VLNLSDIEFVPCLTSSAGSALVQADWQALGVQTVSCHLEALLVKPGPVVLHQISALRDYINWSGRLVLNAATLKCDASGFYQVRSEFDGRVIRMDLEDLLALIAHLSPTDVVLPSGTLASALEQLPESIQLIVLIDDLQQFPQSMLNTQRVTGVSLPWTFCLNETNVSQLLALKATYPQWCFLATGEPSLAEIRRLKTLRIDWFESNAPANDACNGLVYSADGMCSITDLEKAMVFSALDNGCSCPTCLAGFTWAYLHHLYANTTGLCQRLLIQHNVSYVVQHCASDLSQPPL